ncbi:MAG: phospholipase D-like domain-containing protein [Candidatus Bathyarchaeota archaeon]|nr:phospholipase D-like domain-containing protein [Candidatus Bathyarchaeota archaeon]
MIITTYFTKQVDVKSIILELLDGASTQVNVAVAWFTEPKLFKKLIEIQERGVNVELIITAHEFNRNSPNDYSIIEDHGGFYAEIGNDEQLMHMKFCVIDFKTVISGSANWSKSAFSKHNEEVTVVEENLPRANDFMAEFERLKELSGKMAALEKELNVSRALKTFEVIKALINIGDTKAIQPYLYQLKNIPELESITLKLLSGNYDDAIKEIELFKKNYTQIVSVSEVEKTQITTQIKLLSYQIEIIEVEKVEKEAILEHFNHRYILELNPLISEILALKKKIYAKLKKHGIIDDTYEKVEEDFKRTNEEYENEKDVEIPTLSEDDSKTLKQLHREAAVLCHPDSPKCIYEDKEEAGRVFGQLSNAYKANDLEKVRYILNELKLGKPISDLDEFDELAHLRSKLETLVAKYQRLQEEIREIVTSETFKLIQEIEDWDKYFEEQKSLLKEEYKNLKEKYVKHEQQTSEI